jgi:hypothetical protein
MQARSSIDLSLFNSNRQLRIVCRMDFAEDRLIAGVKLTNTRP